MILAPIVRGRKGAYRKELEKLAQDGYVRARINGELVQLDEARMKSERAGEALRGNRQQKLLAECETGAQARVVGVACGIGGNDHVVGVAASE